MRQYIVFVLLVIVKLVSRLFYRVDLRFLGDVPKDPWRHHRLVAILRHTSLYEALFVGGCPVSFLWRVARHGVAPIAQKTADRVFVGRFYGLIANRVVSITRERDETWAAVLDEIDPDAMVLLFPEGRMMRANGLDAEGKPMTVRSGIADLLEAIGEGRMLLAYSGGLHHVQAPGQRLPRLFKRIRMNLEVVDIAAYNAARLAEGGGPKGFRRAVVADLERRRDELCPPGPPAAAGPPSSPGSSAPTAA